MTTDKRSKYDVPHKDECPDCQGRGYPYSTSQVNEGGKTVALGYGCLTCLGVGRLESRQ